MPMDPVVLAPLIKATFDTKYLAENPAYAAIQVDIEPFITAMCEAVAEEVVAHIAAFAQVDGIVVTVTSVSGVTTGASASGPGTGTATAAPGSIT